nr:hypothetical protein FEE99_06765 [Pseudomonas sp. ef1]
MVRELTTKADFGVQYSRCLRADCRTTPQSLFGAHLWRGDLSPLGCEAAPNPAIRFFLTHLAGWTCDCFAAERG